MHEQIELQSIPVKVYRTSDRLMVAAPLPGLEPEDITVVVTNEGRLILDGKLRGILKDVKELLVDEWSVGGYHRELDLPLGVDAERSNVTYENGVLVVMLPISEHTRAAHLTLTPVGHARGQHVGSTGSSMQPTTTQSHQAGQNAHHTK
jgi:HSP20 family protein